MENLSLNRNRATLENLTTSRLASICVILGYAHDVVCAIANSGFGRKARLREMIEQVLPINDPEFAALVR